MGNVLLALFVLGTCIFIYFLPTIVAYQRQQPNHLAIGLLNLFLGWTLVGWVVALVWSVKVKE